MSRASDLATPHPAARKYGCVWPSAFEPPEQFGPAAPFGVKTSTTRIVVGPNDAEIGR
jgi:hypothetical protein